MLILSGPPPIPSGFRIWGLCRWTAGGETAWEAYDEAVAGLVQDVHGSHPDANAIVHVQHSIAAGPTGGFTVLVSGNPIHWPGLKER